jgi:hypothetical protein
MTQAAKRILDAFDALSERERSELLPELLRRAGFVPHDLPNDEDVTSAADRLFVELDARERS